MNIHILLLVCRALLFIKKIVLSLMQNLESMRILVTGSSGFIGSYLLNLLKGDDHELLCADIKHNIDICDWEQVKQYENLDVVIHLANLSYVPDSYERPRYFYQTNYSSTLNMLELCRINHARLIFLSSYVYGTPQYQPIDEKHPIQAFNPYAETKVICEQLCEGYARDFGVPVTIFRPFNIYGKGQNPDFLIPTIIKQAKNGHIQIKDERPKRDYVHVNDVVGTIKAALEINQKSALDVFNIGSGVSYSVKEIIEIVCDLFDQKIQYNCTNEFRRNEILDTVSCIDKAIAELNWKPAISIREGLKSLIDN